MPGERIGGICRDGTYTTATGRGAGSHHGGIAQWVHADSGKTSSSNYASYGGGYHASNNYGFSSSNLNKKLVQIKKETEIKDNDTKAYFQDKLKEEISSLKILLDNSNKQLHETKMKLQNQSFEYENYIKILKDKHQSVQLKAIKIQKRLIQKDQSLKNLIERSDKQLHEANKKIQNQSTEYEQLIQNLKDKQSQKQQKIKKLQKQLKLKEQAYDREKQAFSKLRDIYNRERQAWNKEKEALTNENIKMIQSFDVKIQAERISSDYKCRQLNEQIEATKRQKQKNYKEMSAEQKKELQKIQFDSNFHSSQVSTLNKEITQMKKKHETQMKQIKQEHIAQISKLREEASKFKKQADSIKANEQSHKNELDDLTQMHNQTIKSLKQEMNQKAVQYELKLQLKDEQSDRMAATMFQLKLFIAKSADAFKQPISMLKLNTSQKLYSNKKQAISIGTNSHIFAEEGLNFEKQTIAQKIQQTPQTQIQHEQHYVAEEKLEIGRQATIAHSQNRFCQTVLKLLLTIGLIYVLSLVYRMAHPSGQNQTKIQEL